MTASDQPRSVVLGASIAGLLAARVLADNGPVTLVERDVLPRRPAPRRGVPQTGQVHGLRKRGSQIMQTLLPGLIERAVADGAFTADGVAGLRFVTGGHPLARPATTPGRELFASRALLEHHIREMVRALPGVTTCDGHDVVRPVLTPDGGRVAGVEIRRHDAAAGSRVLAADVVIDATGRGSRMPVWLQELGRTAPPEDRIRVDVGYTTARVRLRPGALGDDIALIVTPVPPAIRGGAIFPVENGEHMACLWGTLGDHPPTEPHAFLAMATTLATPDVHRALDGAQLLSPPLRARFPANVRRRYETLRDVPHGLLVIGDALASFNPVYGQGMTAAAVEAETLAKLVSGGQVPEARRYFRAQAAVVRQAWDLATGSDLSDPRIEGPRPASAKIIGYYMDRVVAAAARDVRVATVFFQVSGLESSPAAVLHPAVLARVARATLRAGRTGNTSAVSPSDQNRPATRRYKPRAFQPNQNTRS